MSALRRFGPNWFTLGMGTGITAIDAYTLPGAPAWLQHAGVALWLVNVVLVSVLTALFVARLIVDHGAARQILHDPVQSLFLGAIPMAITTLVNGFVDMGVHVMGPVALQIAYPLWLLNVALAVGSAVIVPYAMFVSHEHRLEAMTAVWLMPFVPPEVAAASGALLLPHLGSLVVARALMAGSLVLWAFSVPIAFLILGVLFLRLSLHKLPPRELAVTTWITLGTLGTGVMGMVGLGRSMPLVFGAIGQTMNGAAVLLAMALWGFGLWWLVMSILLTMHHARHGVPFNLGWWGLTFPLGVFSVGTNLLNGQLNVGWIGALSVVLFAMLALFWLMVASRTVASLVRLPRPARAASLAAVDGLGHPASVGHRLRTWSATRSDTPSVARQVSWKE